MTTRPILIREYDNKAPDFEETETATFGLGCFWGPDARFGALEGVVTTRVGYAGGTKPDPSYHALGDHTEVFQVDYDPDERSYADLLSIFFRNHRPAHGTRKTQYQNIVLVASRRQRRILQNFLDEQNLDPDAIETRIERLSGFNLAESPSRQAITRPAR